MKLRFTKMHGAGNDFVVMDATQHPLSLSTAQMQFLGDRQFGIGADQILVVERSDTPGIDFRYRIFNGGSGEEVEQCGNGARCFVRYVHDHGLTDQREIRVETMNTQLVLRLQEDGRVTVNMGAPHFDPSALPFDPSGLRSHLIHHHTWWTLPGHDGACDVNIGVASMGNPHAVQRVDAVDLAPVESLGPWVESHPRFARHVNAGFLEIIDRQHAKLRVYERGAGETLSCGTGACAAVVVGIRSGWLDQRVHVQTRGGTLTIDWPGEDQAVQMTGPATTVFEGEIELPSSF